MPIDSLRILLVEGDERRAARFLSLLNTRAQTAVIAPDLSEAAEALSIQRFDVVLLGSGQPSEESARFVTRLRATEAGQRSGPRATVLAYSPFPVSADFLDGSLPDEFGPEALVEAVSRSQAVRQAANTSTEPARGSLAIFEPEQFKEQCAGETELMIEIIDLFSAELDGELPEMAEALARGDFDQLGRLAHTLKGSLGALHASLARQSAQSLEMAAQGQNSHSCAQSLEALNQDLEELNRVLSAFRQACLAR